MVPPRVSPLNSSHSRYSRSRVPLIATLIVAALCAAADARAEVRRRAYLPGPTGVDSVNLAGGLGPTWATTPPRVLAYSPDGRWMYGVTAAGDFQAYDLDTNALPVTINIGAASPVGAVVSPDGLKAYVGAAAGGLVVVDLSGPVPVYEDAQATAPLMSLDMAPDGTWIYVVTVAGDLARYNPSTLLSDQSVALGFTPSVGLDVSPDGTLAVVTGSATGKVQRVNLTNLTLVGSAAEVFGDPRNTVITPDGTTALVADYEGRVLFIDLASGGVSDSFTNLTPLNALGSIDVEPSGQYAWFFDTALGRLFRLDLATRTSGVLVNMPNGTNDVNGKWIGTPIFHDSGSADVIGTDADLTSLGFGREVIVDGPVQLNAGFTSDRTFWFQDTPALSVTAGSAVILTGTLRGSGFDLNGGGTLATTGTYQIGDTTVTNASLLVEGTHDGDLEVVSGGVLRGTGTVGDLIVRNGGSVRPGAATGVGILTSGTTFFQNGGTLAIDIQGTTAGTGYDQLNASYVSIFPGVTLETTLGYAPAPGDLFAILRHQSSGTFSLLPDDSTHDLGGFAAIINYPFTPAADVTLQIHAAPTVAPIPSSAIDEDTTYNGSITIGDDLTAPADLNLLVTSSNQTLVPAANILWGSGGSVRSLQIAPEPGSSGSATITVRVSDPNFFFEESFVLTVDAVNDAPTASPIGPQSTAEDIATAPIALTVDDVDSPVANLIVTASSSDQAIVPNANIVVGGSGANRTLTITPAANAHGTVTISVRTSDGGEHADTSFQLTVTPENDPATISPIADRTIEQDATTGPIAFTITDVDGFDGHVVTASSSNPTLVPNANVNLTLGGAAGARTITVTPAAGQHGTATITLTVDDDGEQATAAFVLTVNAAPEPEPTAITYYLAEGATGPFFDTDLLLANPNSVAAPITLTWLLEGGGTITQSRTLAPMSRTTIQVDAIDGLEAAAFSTMVASTEGYAIAVERTMRWGSGGYGAHTEKASDPGGTTWYFAEGAAGFFSTYLLLGNPQATANTAHVTWLREGEPEVTRSYPLSPNSRFTVDTRADEALIDRSFGARVVFDQPGVAERAMYFGTDPLWSGGHGAAGQTSLATRWDFAEGATGTYFTTFLLLANPGGVPADVTLTFFPEGGAPVSTAYTLAPGQRMTRNIAFEHPSLASAAVAARVTSTEPIVAERAQYWGEPEWIESHNSFGVTSPGRRWVLAEGRVGGDDGAQTYILLSNPGDAPAVATLTFLRTDGTTVVTPVDVPAASRVTVGVTGAGSMVPDLTNESFGTLIESTQPIVVERSLYSNANGVIWAAGTNATAAPLPDEP